MSSSEGLLVIMLKVLRRIIDMVLEFMGHHEAVEKELENNRKS